MIQHRHFTALCAAAGVDDGEATAAEEPGVVRFPLKTSAQPRAQFKVITFDEAFLSQRDRPYVDQILDKIGAAKGW